MNMPMKPFFNRFALLVLLCSSGILRAQQQPDASSYTFSVMQAVDFALQHQPSVKNAQLDQQAATNKVREVVGIALPQINGSGQIQDFLEIPTSFIPAEVFGGQPGTFIPVQFGTKYNATVGVSASQLLFSGEWFLGVKGAKIYQELAQKNTVRTQLETASEVKKAYYSTLVNAERKKLVEANVAMIKRLMDDTRALNQNGFVEQIDVDRVTVAYNNILIEQQNINRLLDLSLVLLKYQMGMEQTATLTLTDDLKSLNLDMPVPQNGPFNYANRIEYQLLDLQLRGSRLQMRANRIGYLPTAALFGSAQYQAQRTKFDIFENKPWYPIVVVGLQVNVPIFDGLQRHYRIQQSRVSIAKAENDMFMIRQTIDLQMAIARANLINSASSINTRQSNVDLAQRVYDVAKKKYEAGVGSNLEVLNAETALKEAQTNYFSALYDAVVAKVEYEKATGTLTFK